MPKKRDKSRSTQHKLVECDVEFPPFQEELIEIEASERDAIFNTFEKIEKMTWQQIFNTSSKGKGKRGLNWEKLEHQVTASGKPIAAIRVSDKFRARVTRSGVYMRFISLHPDHDSAFKAKGGEAV